MQTKINTTIKKHHLVMCSNMIVKKDNKFLIIKRSLNKKIDPGFYHFSGGKVDINEEPLCAAKRELFEEAGIKVKDIRIEAVVTELSPYYKGENWLIFYFSGNYKNGKIKTSPEGEFIWMTKKEILDQKQKFIPSVRVIIDYLLDINMGTVFASFKHYSKKNDVGIKNLHICTCN
jgi:8-oxo-dGTP diphosphatase